MIFRMNLTWSAEQFFFSFPLLYNLQLCCAKHFLFSMFFFLLHYHHNYWRVICLKFWWSVNWNLGWKFDDWAAVAEFGTFDRLEIISADKICTINFNQISLIVPYSPTIIQMQTRLPAIINLNRPSNVSHTQCIFVRSF